MRDLILGKSEDDNSPYIRRPQEYVAWYLETMEAGVTGSAKQLDTITAHLKAMQAIYKESYDFSKKMIRRWALLSYFNWPIILANAYAATTTYQKGGNSWIANLVIIIVVIINQEVAITAKTKARVRMGACEEEIRFLNHLEQTIEQCKEIKKEDK